MVYREGGDVSGGLGESFPIALCRILLIKMMPFNNFIFSLALCLVLMTTAQAAMPAASLMARQPQATQGG